MIDSMLKGKMEMKQVRIARALLAVVVLAMIVTPVALAGTQSSSTGSRSAQKKALALLKSLKKETAAIAGEFAALRTKLAALEGPTQALPSPPIGPAGGDLTGGYPNPKIRPDAIVSAVVADGSLTGADVAANTIESSDLADGAITSLDIADGSLAQSDLGPASVGAPQLLSTHVVKSGPNPIGGNATGENQIACPPGERLLSGGAEWSGTAIPNLYIPVSKPNETNPNEWVVVGRNTSGGSRDLFAYALCLRAA